MFKVNHFEIPTKNVEKAQAFYKNVFGWDFIDYSTPVIKYWGIIAGPYNHETHAMTEPGCINGGLFPVPDDRPFVPISYPAFYVTVDNIEEIIAKATEFGGSATWPKVDIGSGMSVAGMKDPEGNEIGLYFMGAATK